MPPASEFDLVLALHWTHLKALSGHLYRLAARLDEIEQALAPLPDAGQEIEELLAALVAGGHAHRIADALYHVVAKTLRDELAEATFGDEVLSAIDQAARKSMPDGGEEHRKHKMREWDARFPTPRRRRLRWHVRRG